VAPDGRGQLHSAAVFSPHKHPLVPTEKPTDGVPDSVGSSKRNEGYMFSAGSSTKISRLATSKPSYYSDWAIPGLFRW